MKTLRYMMIAAMVGLASLAGGCAGEESDPIDDVDETTNPGESKDSFMQAQQECVAVSMPVSNQWCKQYVDETFVAYFCPREPPELLRTVPLDGRPNWFCGCNPGEGWAECPYNINRDR
jgi:hypothetical protein